MSSASLATTAPCRARSATFDTFATSEPPAGMGYTRSLNDPCIYSKEDDAARTTIPLYVDDGRVYFDNTTKGWSVFKKDKEMLEKRGLSTQGAKPACKDRLMDALGL